MKENNFKTPFKNAIDHIHEDIKSNHLIIFYFYCGMYDDEDDDDDD